jgi:hypothetical protein
MSVLHPSRTTRRLLKIASLGLAGLLAGLFSGCSSTSASLIQPHTDTAWQTSSTYASATASLPPRTTAHSGHTRACFAAPCEPHAAASRTHLSRRQM